MPSPRFATTRRELRKSVNTRKVGRVSGSRKAGGSKEMHESRSIGADRDRLRFATHVSREKWPIQVDTRLGANMFNTALPVAAEVVIAKTVLGRFDDTLQSMP